MGDGPMCVVCKKRQVISYTMMCGTCLKIYRHLSPWTKYLQYQGITPDHVKQIAQMIFDRSTHGG